MCKACSASTNSLALFYTLKDTPRIKKNTITFQEDFNETLLYVTSPFNIFHLDKLLQQP